MCKTATRDNKIVFNKAEGTKRGDSTLLKNVGQGKTQIPLFVQIRYRRVRGPTDDNIYAMSDLAQSLNIHKSEFYIFLMFTQAAIFSKHNNQRNSILSYYSTSNFFLKQLVSSVFDKINSNNLGSSLK